MTGDAGTSPGPGGHRHEGDLDGDPEALEDPVHRGDATHQHDVHERHAHEQEHQGEDTATGAATPDDGD
jgi:hypothetical protein